MIAHCDYPIDLQHGPNPLLDLLPAPDPTALAASAVALANTDGGAVVIGVDQRGAYTGPVDGADVMRARRAAEGLCQPPVSLDQYELLPTPDGPTIAIRVARSTRVHALPDGQVLVRAGGKNRALNGDEIRQLISTRASGDFEADVIPGARPRDLDPQWISDLLVRYTARQGALSGCEADELLLHMGAVTPDAGVTVAGMLLFGLAPQRWLPQSAVRYVRYLDRAGSQVAVERALTGPAVRLIDELWRFVRDQMRAPATLAASDPDYPRAAVREALVNAICHRDYRLRDKHITVSLFPNRLEITSPGGLPGFMTNKSLLNGRYSRNPRLSWGLNLWGYAEQIGGGVMTMILSMDGRGSRPPEIVDGPYHVTVRLFRASDSHAAPDEIAAPPPPLTDCQEAALAYIRAHGSITLRELRTLCATASLDQLQRDLADLVGRGHLRQIGSRARAYYILA
jgi:ATP-dependent DNA helicase RecG